MNPGPTDGIARAITRCQTKNEPTRQPIAKGLPTYFENEIHSASPSSLKLRRTSRF
jgi:hypothetical protein